MANRQRARISVLNRCKATFQAAGATFENVKMLNLGTDGCRIGLAVGAQARISGDSLLEGWTLLNPYLPKEAIRAEIVRIDHDAAAGFLEAEIAFLDLSAAYRQDLKKGLAILENATPQCPSHHLVGMP